MSLARSVSKINEFVKRLSVLRIFFIEVFKMVTKKIKTLAALKTRLKKTLPEKISEVIASYETFSEQPVPDDAKGFSAHHSACKSAVVHAETLLKLARWTEDEKPAPDSGTMPDIEELLREARNEIDGFEDDD